MKIIYTVCNRTNLAHALTLAESVSKYQPEAVFYLCWVDPISLPTLPVNIKVLQISDAGIPHWTQMKSDYNSFELLAACRPWFALALLQKHTNSQYITFLAPTVVLFDNFDSIMNSKSDLFLTPNITSPLAPSHLLDDKRILNVGMFHAGSWILKVSEKTINVLKWWAERTVDRAKFDLCEGMNLDQLWLNYLPIWLPETSIIRNSGWHYGLHSVLNVPLKSESAGFKAGNEKLISVDFAGLDYFDPVWSNHAGLLSQNQAFQGLFKQYRESLKKNHVTLSDLHVPNFGKAVNIKKNRILRNNLAGKLKSLTEFIDQF
ncbi:hypothetical protein [Dyadobacter luticola]|uniref:Glycosyl transferase n=1 Tax=Dyadobacter luticola TaxID=1979387 RepID=A0A5R9KSB9_9BACT|nr:hypothetical protein [Dyadobacter luticola]TLU99171.1 hypothetical protein FEN17_21590 [Dyadobacter luticola]